MDLWGVAVGATIASIAWIYQRAWEHQERQIARYREILDRLPAFTCGNLDPGKIDEVLLEGRRLWVSAPDEVVLAYENLLDLIVARDTKPDLLASALGECVKTMRQDATFSAALFPRFWNTKLHSGNFLVRSAAKKTTS